MREKWGEDKKKARGDEGRSKERDGKEETIDNRLLKNLRGRWRPQYSDWPVWLFRQQVSRHDGISSFSIVMTACSFENFLKLKPQQYSACLISKIFRSKSWDFLQSIRNRLSRYTRLDLFQRFRQKPNIY